MAVKTKYKKGEKVVYPLQGVGEITLIDEKKFNEKSAPYYTIYIQASDMTVMIPVENADTIGIRPISSKNKASKTMECISKPTESLSSDWKERYQFNLDKLKSGDIDSNAYVVCSLYCRSKLKPLPILERKLFDSAVSILLDELSLALNKEKDKLREEIFEKLEVGL